MKLITFLVMTYSFTALAGNCEERWKKLDAQNPVRSVCQLEWDNVGIELVSPLSGCSFQGPEKTSCMYVRTCDEALEKGIERFFEGTSPSSFCLIKDREDDVLGSKKKEAPVARIRCSGLKKPSALLLASPDLKHQKNCPFPFKNAK